MPEKRVAKYLALFRRDVAQTLSRSEDEFGVDASDRYAALIIQALRDIAEDPLRPGATTRPMLGENVRIYHLTFSRNRVVGGKVKTPRHFVLYRFHEDHVQFARLLHDSRDLMQHIPHSLRGE